MQHSSISPKCDLLALIKLCGLLCIDTERVTLWGLLLSGGRRFIQEQRVCGGETAEMPLGE